MSRWNSGWDRGAMAEYRELMHGACDASRENSRRKEVLLDRLNDALQAHRDWARDMEDEIRLRGALSLITSFARAERTVLVAMSDRRSLLKSKDIGIKLVDDSGQIYEQRAFFEELTWEQIEDKRAAYLKGRRAYDDNVAIMDRLAALRLMAVGTSTVGEACDRLGISVDEYLLEADADAA